MNFLDRLAIPESAEHIELLRVLLVIVTLLFVIYASIALVASTSAAVAEWLGRKRGDKNFSKFAKDLADLAAPGKGVILALGVLPLIALVLIYVQLLYGMRIGAAGYLTASAIFYFVGFYFLYSYKKSFHFDSIYSTFRSLASATGASVMPEIAEEVDKFERSAVAVRRRGGRRSAILLLIGTWLFVGTTRLVLTPARWSHPVFASVVFSGDAIWSLIDFIIAALVITSASVLFFFFRWEKGIALTADTSYRAFVKRYTLPVGITAAALEPILIFFQIQNLPQSGVSNMTFVIACIAMFIALLVMLLFYSMLKEANVYLGSYAFIGVVLLVLAWAAKDEIAFHYATQGQDQRLATRYQTMLASLSPGTVAPVMSGVEIYNNICSACHMFNTKKVGPPYFMTLPHFVGKMDSLEDFISNPYQAVPGYPPMPKQPLKPQEVNNVAQYIMGVYLAAKKAGKAQYTQ